MATKRWELDTEAGDKFYLSTCDEAVNGGIFFRVVNKRNEYPIDASCYISAKDAKSVGKMLIMAADEVSK